MDARELPRVLPDLSCELHAGWPSSYHYELELRHEITFAELSVLAEQRMHVVFEPECRCDGFERKRMLFHAGNAKVCRLGSECKHQVVVAVARSAGSEKHFVFDRAASDGVNHEFDLSPAEYVAERNAHFHRRTAGGELVERRRVFKMMLVGDNGDDEARDALAREAKGRSDAAEACTDDEHAPLLCGSAWGSLCHAVFIVAKIYSFDSAKRGAYSASMGIKSFLVKKALQAKGMSKEQAEIIGDKLANDPGMAEKLKALEGNKELKELFENIQKEIDEKKKAGMPEQYAAMMVMTKYKDQVAKHREELGPLMELMMSLQGK